MACSCVSDVKSIDTGLGIDGTASSLELDHIPLTQRRKLLHTRYGHSNSDDSDSCILEDEHRKTLITPVDAGVKKEYGDCDLEYGAVVRMGCNWQETQACLCPSLQQVTCPTIQTNASGAEKTSVNISSLPQCPMLCDVPATIKVKKEISDDIVDDLDHIVLKERQRMLLARRLPGLPNPAFEGGIGGLLENIMEHTVEKIKEEIYSADGKTTGARYQCYDNPEGNNASLFELPLGATAGSSLSTDYASPKSTKSIISAGLQEHDNMFKSGGMIMQFDLHEERGVIPIKNDGPTSSTCPTSVKVKDEPWDNSEIHNVNKDAMGNISIKLPNVKSEWEVHNKDHDDRVEHMCLIERLNFLMSQEDSSLNISPSYSSLKKTRASAFKLSSVDSGCAEPLSIKRPRKRKKTATDSVETALEEDAPGLLQVLLNKGVLVDEIKLYGETGSDEALDESFCEDSFSMLEAVISKLFSQRHSFLKFPTIRAAKASKASYCLACLISLVEQTRYLQFRKWPVEWGWCRDLQSFIFVFERHNRIVLERPEYGYATYFFELVESLPVEWQIKRLVTAMKLTTCSRISLIENKELLIGEDLTEGEAKVLMEYGWTPNSGLGTMLNYCDRVVHDRKNEKDSSEWRSKIGKLLMDGYNGGTIVTTSIPKKVVEYRRAQSPNISSSLMSN